MLYYWKKSLLRKIPFPVRTIVSPSRSIWIYHENICLVCKEKSLEWFSGSITRCNHRQWHVFCDTDENYDFLRCSIHTQYEWVRFLLLVNSAWKIEDCYWIMNIFSFINIAFLPSFPQNLKMGIVMLRGVCNMLMKVNVYIVCIKDHSYQKV